MDPHKTSLGPLQGQGVASLGMTVHCLLLKWESEFLDGTNQASPPDHLKTAASKRMGWSELESGRASCRMSSGFRQGTLGSLGEGVPGKG